MQIGIFSKHHIFKYDFWEKTRYSNMNFRCFLVTPDFGPISTKLGGTVQTIKKMTQKDNGPGPGRNYGETGVFTFGRKVVFGLKMGLTPKNHPK